jgi:hypothetical protein
MNTKKTFADMDLLRTIVEEEFNVDIMKKDRKRRNVDARMCFAKILKEEGYTHTLIGEYIGKDHSTIVHYVQQIPNVMMFDKNVFNYFVTCKTKFLENKESSVIPTEKSMANEVVKLRNQMENIMSYYDSVKATEKKYERLSDIINIIDSKTRKGEENSIKIKINQMLNEQMCKT